MPEYPIHDLEYLKGLVADALGEGDPHATLVAIEAELETLIERAN